MPDEIKNEIEKGSFASGCLIALFLLVCLMGGCKVIHNAVRIHYLEERATQLENRLLYLEGAVGRK